MLHMSRDAQRANSNTEMRMCAISSREPLTNRLWQRHVLDRGCLLTWLSSNTSSGACPVCRTALIQTKNSALSPVSFEEVRQVLTDPSHVWQDFGITTNEQGVLPHLDDSGVIFNVLSADNEVMTVHAESSMRMLVFTGNLVLATAQARGSPYLATELERFHKLVRAMRAHLRDQDGALVNVAEFPGELLYGTVLKLLEQGFDVEEMELFVDTAENGQYPGRQILQMGTCITYVLWQVDRELTRNSNARVVEDQANE